MAARTSFTCCCPAVPWLIAEFGFSYSNSGVLVSVFFVISGVGQACRIFLVDRVGARPVMFLRCRALRPLGWWRALPGLWGLVVAAALAGAWATRPSTGGLHHPEQARIPQRLGHGFAVHSISGNLGWPMAPVFMAGIATATGSWRTASLCGAAFALLVLAIMVINRDALDDRRGEWAHPGQGRRQCAGSKPEHPWPSSNCLRCGCAFHVLLLGTCALSAIQSFASPRCNPCTACPERDGHGGHGLHAVQRWWHGGGGFLVEPRAAAGKVISVCLLASAVLLAVVGARAVAGHGGRGGGFHRRPGHRPGRPIARHAHQTCRPPAPRAVRYGTVYQAWTWLCLAAPCSAPCWTGA